MTTPDYSRRTGPEANILADILGPTKPCYPPLAMTRVPTRAYHGSTRPEFKKARRIGRNVVSLVVGAAMLLAATILAAAQVAFPGTDSTAVPNVPAPDPVLRWRFDTGG